MTTRRWFIVSTATLAAGTLLCTACDPASPEAAADIDSAERTEPSTDQAQSTETPVPTPVPQSDDQAKTECPFGLINDPAPGRCRRYVDKNDNGFCDYSEPA